MVLVKEGSKELKYETNNNFPYKKLFSDSDIVAPSGEIFGETFDS